MKNLKSKQMQVCFNIRFMRARIFIILGILIGGCSIFTPLVAQDKLDEYLYQAAENNPHLKMLFDRYMASMEQVSQVGALPNPQVAFAYFVSPVETRTGPQRAKVSLEQQFPWFGTLREKEDGATKHALAQYQIFEDAKRELFKKVKEAYFNLYLVEQSIKIVEESISVLQRLKTATLSKISTDKVSLVNAYHIEMKLNDKMDFLAQLNEHKKEYQVSFNKLLDTASNATILVPSTLSYDTIVQPFSNLKEKALLDNHRLVAIDLSLQAIEAQKKVAQKSGNPSFMVGVDYTFIGNGGTDAIIFPRIGVSLPINRKKYSAAVREKTYLSSAKTSEKQATANQIETTLQKVWTMYLNAQRAIALNKKQIVLSTKILAILQQRYQVSSVEIEELLRIEQSVLNYKLELQKGMCEKELAVANIRYLSGT